MKTSEHILQIILCIILLILFEILIFYEPNSKKEGKTYKNEYYQIIEQTFSQSLNLKK